MKIYRWAVALLCAVLLAALAASASASHLSLNEHRFKTVYSPIFAVPSFGSTVRCSLTLEGSFHERTVAKVLGALIGYVTNASVGSCEAGRMRMNTETLPWHRQYTGFAGTLPNITIVGIRVVRMSFEIEGEIFGIRLRCRYTPALEPFAYERESRGAITEERPETSATASETEECPSVHLEGSAAVTTPTGGHVVISLI